MANCLFSFKTHDFYDTFTNRYAPFYCVFSKYFSYIIKFVNENHMYVSVLIDYKNGIMYSSGDTHHFQMVEKSWEHKLNGIMCFCLKSKLLILQAF